ncbi:uncharacterized protein LOC126656107 [Mercurialis annua]|uniref:uncharacterized protein LOC126656107 n=1 Tax=Mercurialis annua TaxID=3986 RepID=UPI00215E977F|nr:uncharacterized protein LOC126656107 [Mercurialis annua]
MAGRRELGFPNTGGRASSLREQLARKTLKSVRSKGHPYVELREDGKCFVFFCTLCLAPCYSPPVLFDHLKGKLHTKRLSTAKLTLLKENPWPFSDGVQFFNNSTENDEHLLIKNDNKSLANDNSNLAIVKHAGNGKPAADENVGCDEDANDNGRPCDLVIQDILIRDDLSDLNARFMGFGQIAARFIETDGNLSEISRIWCEWLGESVPENKEKDKVKVVDHEFAVITFAYICNLGRPGLIDDDDDTKLLLPSGPAQECHKEEGNNRKRKKSSPDPENISGPPTRLMLDRHDHQLLPSTSKSRKNARRELRRQARIAAERICDICQQKILLEKDVATLVNMKTGQLACIGRNSYGQFHVFHTSCLILWILLSEYEMAKIQPVSAKERKKSRRKNGTKSTEAGKGKLFNCQIGSVFCPECQGTGATREIEARELPTIYLPEMFKYRIKVGEGRRAWMKSPEMVENCSIGFHFPCPSERAVQEKVSPLKLLRFYRADV